MAVVYGTLINDERNHKMAGWYEDPPPPYSQAEEHFAANIDSVQCAECGNLVGFVTEDRDDGRSMRVAWNTFWKVDIERLLCEDCGEEFWGDDTVGTYNLDSV